MRRSFQSILKICHENKYFQFDRNTSSLKYLNLGSILSENIKKYWFNSEKDIKVYLKDPLFNYEKSKFNDLEQIPKILFNNPEFHKKVMYIKNNLQLNVPFAIPNEISCQQSIFPLIESDEVTAFESSETLATKYLSCSYFIDPASSKEIFNRLQHSKKIWWMKFTSNPGRIFLAERQSNQKFDSVSIKARFQFGNLELEKIQLFPLQNIVEKNLNEYCMKSFDTGKEILPFIIYSETSLDIATMGFLCDAIESSEINDILYLHRRIAPYQCCILSSEISSDINDLIRYISLILKTSDISVLIKKPIDTIQFNNEIAQMDKIGVPYSIIIDQNTLKSGLLNLRSRDTSLSEKVILSDLSDYLVKIINA